MTLPQITAEKEAEKAKEEVEKAKKEAEEAAAILASQQPDSKDALNKSPLREVISINQQSNDQGVSDNSLLPVRGVVRSSADHVASNNMGRSLSIECDAPEVSGC